MRDPFRGTGRTTRMLQKAMIRMVESGGNPVVVVCGSDVEITYIQNLLLDFPIRPSRWSRGRGPFHYGKYRMHFYSIRQDDQDFRGWRRENVFIDHNVWRSECSGTLSLLQALYC